MQIHVRNFLKPLVHPIIHRSITKSWSQTGLVYHIYPQSFKDSNNDGIGDLQGIIDTLDYLNNGKTTSLGVNTIWLSPIYPSPMKDNGYDPSDYYHINPLFGDLKTFDRLVAQCHWRGMKVMLDFVENHTSEEHPWFLASKSSKNNEKSDWYIWKDPAPGGGVPNNWLSVFGGSAWEYVPERNQYYLHSFFKEQPDLNWRNADVRKEMKRVLRFWIKRGVDGFRCDAANHLIKDDKFRDEPLNPEYKSGTTKPWYRYLHPYMRNRPETPILLGHLTDFVEEFGDIFMITEANIPIAEMHPYYAASNTHRLMPFNFNLFKLAWNAQDFRSQIDEYEETLGKYDLPNYVLGNHDRPRLASRFTASQTRTVAMLLLTLRGMPFIYQGDELGMTNTKIPRKYLNDSFGEGISEVSLSRDPSRTPMQWNKQPFAGFSRHVPWLPVNANYKTVNVHEEHFDPHSLLNLYRHLIHLRMATPALLQGQYRSIDTGHEDVFGFVRTYEKKSCLILLNFSNKKVMTHPCAGFFAGRILLSTYLDRKEEDMYLQDVPLRADEGLIIRL